MTTFETTAWDAIARPRSDFNVRQVDVRTSVPCFWGRDQSGAYLFILQLQGDYSAWFRRNFTDICGVRVELRGDGPGIQRLVLALESDSNRDLFESLCRSLIIALSHTLDSATSLQVAVSHIRRWKTFLSGTHGKLSAEEVRGLFAELCFLRELLDNRIAPRYALDAWFGPERSHQDFIFGNSSIEVKSIAGTERQTVRISSEDQLESLNDSLYLRIYRLSNSPNAAGAQSLNDVIKTLSNHFERLGLLEEFSVKLAQQRYAPLQDYDAPEFSVAEIRSFCVRQEFPRLVRSSVPNGITRLSYDLQLEAIANFECANDEVFKDM